MPFGHLEEVYRSIDKKSEEGVLFGQQIFCVGSFIPNKAFTGNHLRIKAFQTTLSFGQYKNVFLFWRHLFL